MTDLDSLDPTERPSLDQFDWSQVREPDDGILYLYRTSIDGFWRVSSGEDMALQEATGRPVAELVREEAFEKENDGECGDLIALYVTDEPSRPAQPSTADIELIHQGDRDAILEANGDQARELYEQENPTISCPCGRSGPLTHAFQCYYCGVFLCSDCAETHFGSGDSHE